MTMRLQRYLALCGIASRRKCEEHITRGRVIVNGVTVVQLGTCVTPEKDKVLVDGREIFPPKRFVYYVLNKPAGYVVTLSDSHGTPTVMALLRDIRERVFPVGRLDMDTEGLLLLTNDGELANRLMHPRYHLEKEYIITVRRELNEHNLNWLRKGIELEGKVTQPAQIRLIKKSREYICYRMVIHEGRKRQIREMFKAAGHPVLTLKRIAIGSVHLGTLTTGRYRPLTHAEVGMLRKAAGLVSEKGGKGIENKKEREGYERRGISGVRNK